MLKKILLLSALFTFAACDDVKLNNAASATNTANTTASATTAESVAKQLFEHFNAHDWAKMADLYDPNADFLDPSYGTKTVKQTHEQLVQKYNELQQLIPDIHDSIVGIYPSGEKTVAVRFIGVGTAPDKTKFETPICAVLIVENGKIVQDYTYYNEEK